MCGIFGLVVSREAGYSTAFIKKSLVTLAHASQSRGKDSSGLVFRDDSARTLKVLKGSVPISYLLKRAEVAEQIDSMLEVGRDLSAGGTFSVMGHSRLVTNGSQVRDENNQPVVKDGVVGVHNGIIVNDAELWSRYPDIQQKHEIDTEVLLSLVRRHLREGQELKSAISKAVNEVFGTVAAAFYLDDLNQFAIATNNGSLYVLTGEKGFFAFASEEYFLTKLAETMGLDDSEGYTVRQVQSGTGCVLDLKKFNLDGFAFTEMGEDGSSCSKLSEPYGIKVEALSDGRSQRELILDPAKIAAQPIASTEAKLLEHNHEEIEALRRCTKCLLPETFPFIEYDENGVCNYCHNYVIKNKPKPIEELFDMVEPYRRSDGRNDCIIPYSGGRDSTHTLHIVKNVLKLNPIAFTYDWGMVNDLARRNIARVCGRMGVENIIVSADIAWKRENIRKNIAAWLRRPNLGMVPLFMAGDKYFYYYCDQVKRQTGIKLNIWGVNPLENTDFKVGFLGVPPDHNKKRIYSLSAKRKGKLLMSMGSNILRNPRYLNRSVWDTIGSFISRSVSHHSHYYHMYDYYRWDEKEIEDLVLGEYEWEKAIDTDTTWRIGDGTAPFYNYVYYTVAGFSEYDTFRSNQIREGALTREEGLRLVNEENRPRYASIKWYLEILGLDYEETIKRVNSIPKLYRKESL